MTIIFVSNFINHYQVPLCDELYKLTNSQFWFVETQELPRSFRDSGFPDYEKPYLIRAWNSKMDKQRALSLSANADILIAGGGKFVIPYEKVRLRNNKITFEYAERSLKRGWTNLFSPTNLKMQLYYHLFFHNKPFYKLCASAYTARDMYLQHAFIGKCFKFGYFPQIPSVNIEELLDKKYEEKRIRIIWCARFIKWKHPEIAVLLADKLKRKGYDFELNMIGSGVLYHSIEKMIKNLNLMGFVNLLGNYPNNEVLKIMADHHIFLFTSDRNEGWGVVLNEAMGRGCCPVASHTIGAVPYLLRHKENGVVFESGNIDSLTESVEFLMQNQQEMRRLARNAYMSIKRSWTPEFVAERLVGLFNEMLNGNMTYSYCDGPLSVALPISEEF